MVTFIINPKTYSANSSRPKAAPFQIKMTKDPTRAKYLYINLNIITSWYRNIFSQFIKAKSRTMSNINDQGPNKG